MSEPDCLPRDAFTEGARAAEFLADLLVLAGQTRSHAQLASVLDPEQLALYTAWEDRQVEAFKNRRWNDRRRRR